MPFPLWLLVAVLLVEAWPVVLVVGLGCAAVAVGARGWVRGMAAVAALACGAVVGVAAWWSVDARERDRAAAAFEVATQEVLDRDRVVDGIPLPAGSALTWWDVHHARLHFASPPKPAAVFGMHVTYLRQEDDGAWSLLLPAAEVVEGWTCGAGLVVVSASGRLRSCRLAAVRDWRGWSIPADTLLTLPTEGGVDLVLPQGFSLAAPEIGHAVGGNLGLNEDGSLRSLYLDSDDPLHAAGALLANALTWTYDPATLGRGRRRRASSVRGWLLTSEGGFGPNVSVDLSTGRMTNAE